MTDVKDYGLCFEGVSKYAPEDRKRGVSHKKYKGIVLIITMAVFYFCALTGCEFSETSEEKIKDLDYTVCDESRLPGELKKLINEKKKEPFKFTYRTNDYLYIVVGYGAQDRIDLNVVMTELYLTENAIFVDTDLTTKETTTLDDGLVSYPWIAVKCELYDVPVNFK